jgi:hypothetical protein
VFVAGLINGSPYFFALSTHAPGSREDVGDGEESDSDEDY